MITGTHFRNIAGRQTWISGLTLALVLAITPTAAHAQMSWLTDLIDIYHKYQPIISAGSAGKAVGDVYREKKEGENVNGAATLAGLVTGTAPNEWSDHLVTKFGKYGNTLNDMLGNILASNPNYGKSDKGNFLVSDVEDAEKLLHDAQYDIPVFGDILSLAEKFNKKLADLKDKGKWFAAIGNAIENIFGMEEEPSPQPKKDPDRYLLRPRKDGEFMASDEDATFDKYTRPGENARQMLPVETAGNNQIEQQAETTAPAANQVALDPLMFIVKLNDQGASTTMVEEESDRRYAFIRVCSAKPVRAPTQVTIRFGGTATFGQDYRIPFDEDRTYKEGTIRTMDDMSYLTKNPFTYTFTPEKSYFLCLLEAEADNLVEGEESVIIEVIDVVGAGPWQAEPLHLRILDADQAGLADQQAGRTNAQGQDEPKWKITETDEYSSVVEMWTEFKSIYFVSREEFLAAYGGSAGTMSEAQKRKAWREFRYYGGDANERAVNDAFGGLTEAWKYASDYGRDANYREVLAALSTGGRQYVAKPFAILGYRIRCKGVAGAEEANTVDKAYAIFKSLPPRQEVEMQMRMRLWFIDFIAFEKIRMEDMLANPHAIIDQTYRNAAADYQAKGGDPEAVQRQLEQENAARPDFSTFDPDALMRKLMEMMPKLQAAAQRGDPDEVIRLWRQFDAEVPAPPPEALANDPELKATWDMLQQLRAMGKMAE